MITRKPQTTSTSTTLSPRRTVTTKITTRTPSTTTSGTTIIVPTTKNISAPKKTEATTSKMPYKKSEVDALSVDKIPVVVIQENSSRGFNNKTRKIVSASVAIVTPNEEISKRNADSQLILGEILQYKRCPQGYSRDKLGRCRKMKIHQLG